MPAGHLWSSKHGCSSAVVGQYEPAGHIVSTTEPSRHNVPIVLSLVPHSLISPGDGQKWSTGHGTSEVDLLGQYDVREHAVLSEGDEQ